MKHCVTCGIQLRSNKVILRSYVSARHTKSQHTCLLPHILSAKKIAQAKCQSVKAPASAFLSDRRARSTAALSAPVCGCSVPGQRLVITYYLKNKLAAQKVENDFKLFGRLCHLPTPRQSFGFLCKFEPGLFQPQWELNLNKKYNKMDFASCCYMAPLKMTDRTKRHLHIIKLRH